LGGYPKLLQRRGRKRRFRVQQYCDSFIAWDELLQDLQPLAADVARLGAHPGDVGAGSAQACDQSRADRVPDGREYDRDRRGCGLRRLCRERPHPRDQQVRAGANGICCQLRQPLRSAFSGAVVKNHIVSLAVAQLV
jgi:hypothetical protein